MDKTPVYIKMDTDVYNDAQQYMLIARKLKIKELTSMKKMVDAALIDFMNTHPLDVRIQPVKVEGLTNPDAFKNEKRIHVPQAMSAWSKEKQMR